MVIFNSYVKLPESKSSVFWGFPVCGSSPTPISSVSMGSSRENALPGSAARCCGCPVVPDGCRWSSSARCAVLDTSDDIRRKEFVCWGWSNIYEIGICMGIVGNIIGIDNDCSWLVTAGNVTTQLYIGYVGWVRELRKHGFVERNMGDLNQ